MKNIPGCGLRISQAMALDRDAIEVAYKRTLGVARRQLVVFTENAFLFAAKDLEMIHG